MLIEINNLSKEIGNELILKDINMRMESGHVYGIKGKNGSGKTMLMRAICGLIFPTHGSIMIDGKELGKDLSFPESVGALLENPGFINEYSGVKNLKTLAAIQNKVGYEEICEVLVKVGLDPSDNKKFKKYSLGMKQKLGIAGAIFENPELVILDEPTNALDEKSIVSFKEIIKELKARHALVIISCHDTEDLQELSDTIFTMENGSITAMEKCNPGYDYEK
ncbi:ATP-binding cassette domain-containing protein [Murimonas intestini]|uniref:ABC-2 type transport system ATP-binding protein n=1 Tax=Murimonas intestini TaxID=1337051 RepID=A0AB73T8B7_9FIRM|nr:ATP-binding cassette domain-containing protein [Murimonas intestini]MCR1839910.1 ATP-binding cassette domain-containing protein [Murimonas intestini]MCR1866751.1 ATP-binding cassette domain-containing protein [Murimonas intestini]MCR1883584.1 ATP-binding cassette domain-containing protein [Murimonas intestini]